jgi:hypothetical protein
VSTYRHGQQAAQEAIISSALTAHEGESATSASASALAAPPSVRGVSERPVVVVAAAAVAVAAAGTTTFAATIAAGESGAGAIPQPPPPPLRGQPLYRRRRSRRTGPQPVSRAGAPCTLVGDGGGRADLIGLVHGGADVPH